MTARRVFGRIVAGLAGAFACSLMACSAPSTPPQGQILLYLDTDAPLASATGAPTGMGDPIPLFDRARIDVYAPGATAPCDACTNEFAISTEPFAALRASVGIVPPASAPGWRVRVRLMVDRFMSDGEPDPGATIDVIALLPAIGPTGVVSLTVPLFTDSVGQPVGSLDAPVAPISGSPSASRVGTWAGGTRTPCASAPGPGQVCVPGGAFWMGAPRDHVVAGTDPSWHRLVVLSPFFLDSTEVTVASARAAGVSGVTPWDQTSSPGSTLDTWCSYAAAPTRRDALSLSCITWQGAHAFCAARGATLPTEAQLEYAEGGLKNQLFPWGDDDPSCTDAVWGRNGYGVEAFSVPDACRDSANFLAPMGGPEPPMHGQRDVIALPTGSLYDLGANLSEWGLDGFALRSDPCWTPPGILRDPTCTATQDGHVAKGGAWTFGGTALEASLRFRGDPSDAFSYVGFRCAAAPP